MIGVLSRKNSTSERSLAETGAVRRSRFADGSGCHMLGKATRRRHASVGSLPYYHIPSSDGQSASPSAVLPVFFRERLWQGREPIARFGVYPVKCNNQGTVSWVPLKSFLRSLLQRLSWPVVILSAIRQSVVLPLVQVLQLLQAEAWDRVLPSVRAQTSLRVRPAWFSATDLTTPKSTVEDTSQAARLRGVLRFHTLSNHHKGPAHVH